MCWYGFARKLDHSKHSCRPEWEKFKAILIHSNGWKHIPGELNVADDVSRGISVQDLTQKCKSGPDSLSHPEEQWPETISAAVEDKDVNTERRKTPVVCTVSTTKESISCTNFSSWRKLVRVTTRIQKLAAKARSKREGSNAIIETENHGTLTPKQFSPFVDDEGIIRVGGRLSKAMVTYDCKHPAMLPYKHWVSLLITRHMHQRGPLQPPPKFEESFGFYERIIWLRK